MNTIYAILKSLSLIIDCYSTCTSAIICDYLSHVDEMHVIPQTFPAAGQSAEHQRHTRSTAPLEVIIFQCSAEQMMQTRGLSAIL